ncbi:hypothetical protein DSI35_27165 [Mycobacterium tuberculosis]|nr:hypothetical protein DSI35_27165 [Mycobacterium tuberculosis]
MVADSLDSSSKPKANLFVVHFCPWRDSFAFNHYGLYTFIGSVDVYFGNTIFTFADFVKFYLSSCLPSHDLSYQQLEEGSSHVANSPFELAQLREQLIKFLWINDTLSCLLQCMG